MDGFKGWLNASVQRRLAAALLVAIAAVALVAAALSFLAAYDEARELQDDLLRQVAQLVDRQRLAPTPSPLDAHFKDRDEASRLIVQRLGQANPAGLDVDDGGPLPLTATLADGLYTLAVSGESFRVLVATTAAGERIAVAQESDFRDDMARASALRTVMPFAVLLPLLLVLVATLVRRLFRPIAALAQDIDRRSEQDLRAVDLCGIPSEVRSFVGAINRLLARIARTMTVERRFVADAAHELRSPLAALSLQAERLEATALPAEARERLQMLRRGIERGRSLVDQLLALARAQASDAAASAPAAPCSVQVIYRRVLEDLMPLADARRIDLGVEGAQDAAVRVQEPELIALVRNLVDNAIRYTPEGGRVDLSVRVERGLAVLGVRDSGPGIAPAERGRVFDPFYRTPGSEHSGSGLGLAIVRAIGERIGARIELDHGDAATQSGLLVSVFIAQAEPGTAPPA